MLPSVLPSALTSSNLWQLAIRLLQILETSDTSLFKTTMTYVDISVDSSYRIGQDVEVSVLVSSSSSPSLPPPQLISLSSASASVV